MRKTKTQAGVVAAVLDVLSLLASIAVLLTVAQHVDHLNQVNQHLTAIYLSHTTAPGFIVKPDLQLVPLVPLTAALITGALLLRRRLSVLLLISLTFFISGCTVWLLGFHLAHIR